MKTYLYSTPFTNTGGTRSLLGVVLALLFAGALATAQTPFIFEHYDPITGEGFFGILNNTPKTIVAFAVANDTIYESDGSHEFYRVWATGLMTDDNWDAEKDTFAAAVGLTSIPSFGDLFPGGYSQAVVYWADDLMDPDNQAIVAGLSWEPDSLRKRDPAYQDHPVYFSRPILPGDDATYPSWGMLGFTFSAESAASPFAVLTWDAANGYEVITGQTEVVLAPEPTVMTMVLLGFAGIGRRLLRPH